MEAQNGIIAVVYNFIFGWNLHYRLVQDTVLVGKPDIYIYIDRGSIICYTRTLTKEVRCLLMQ